MTGSIPYQRALVTGANGFIGAALVKRLLAEGVNVRAVVRNPANGRDLVNSASEATRTTGANRSGKGGEISRIAVVTGDVQDAAAMRHHAVGCDVVFHVAAVGAGSAAVQYQANVRGAENVARAAAAAGAERLVHISSVAAYGLQVRGDITETQPLNPSPRDFYQQSKALGETAVWRCARQSGLPTTVVRPAFVYGPRAVIWTAALYDICRRLPVVPRLPGSAHPIFVTDLVDLLLTVAVHPDAPGEAFQASADPAVPWPEFLGHYATLAGNTHWLPLPGPVLNRLADVLRPLDSALRLSGQPTDVSGMLRYVGATITYKMTKAAEVLDWQPTVSLAEGMAACAEWLTAQD